MSLEFTKEELITIHTILNISGVASNDIEREAATESGLRIEDVRRDSYTAWNKIDEVLKDDLR